MLSSRSFGLLAIVSLGAFAAVASACSSSSDDATASPVVDAGVGSEHCDASSAKCPGNPPADAGALSAPACYQVTSITAPITIVDPVAHQGACTATQIDGYADACLAEDAGTDADGGSICDDFVAANPTCTDCIVGSGSADGGVPMAPVLLPSSDGGVYANIDGCYAATTNGVSDTCKEAYEALEYCAALACSTCSAADEDACVGAAVSDPAGCPSAYPVESTCLHTITSSASSDCYAQDLDFIGNYRAVATTLCGP
ncbi:MAG TPA: hypothetical protein VF407_16975 [Polyangiaceae bacterium]